MIMRKIRITNEAVLRAFIFLFVLNILLSGCSAIGTMTSAMSPNTPGASQAESTLAGACPVTEAVLAIPPDDSAVQGPPGPGYYYVNEDRSIWASAWWTEAEENRLRASEEGIKVGWFRPTGTTLEITGQRLDAHAPPLEAHVPCCYPTRFQATGVIFPTQGCWEVTARAADSVLSFVVKVEP